MVERLLLEWIAPARTALLVIDMQVDFASPDGAAGSAGQDLSAVPLAVANAAGSVVMGGSPWFWAAPFERDAEFGGRGLPPSIPAEALGFRTKAGQRESTTLVVVATDAILTKAQAKRLAVMAQTGLARAIYPVHTPLDGDVVFAAATGRKQLSEPLFASKLVPRSVSQMLYSGEKSGKLAMVMEQVSAYAELELKEQITNMTRYIEPLMIVVMGLIIGGVALALLLPIFTISKVLAQ